MARERVGKKPQTLQRSLEKELNRSEGSGEREATPFLLVIHEHYPVSRLMQVMERKQLTQPSVQGAS